MAGCHHHSTLSLLVPLRLKPHHLQQNLDLLQLNLSFVTYWQTIQEFLQEHPKGCSLVCMT